MLVYLLWKLLAQLAVIQDFLFIFVLAYRPFSLHFFRGNRRRFLMWEGEHFFSNKEPLISILLHAKWSKQVASFKFAIIFRVHPKTLLTYKYVNQRAHRRVSFPLLSLQSGSKTVNIRRAKSHSTYSSAPYKPHVGSNLQHNLSKKICVTSDSYQI